MPHTIEIVHVNDDWEELVVDGEIKREGHSLDVTHVLEALDIPFTLSQVYRNIYTDEPVATLEEAYAKPGEEGDDTNAPDVTGCGGNPCSPPCGFDDCGGWLDL